MVLLKPAWVRDMNNDYSTKKLELERTGIWPPARPLVPRGTCSWAVRCWALGAGTGLPRQLSCAAGPPGGESQPRPAHSAPPRQHRKCQRVGGREGGRAAQSQHVRRCGLHTVCANAPNNESELSSWASKPGYPRNRTRLKVRVPFAMKMKTHTSSV